MVIPDIQMQVTQGNSQGISAFSGLSSSFSNQTTPPPAQPYPGQAQQPHQLSQQQSHLSSSHSHLQGPSHVTNSQQQAYAMRLAKERQLQHQRYLQHHQQQQQLAAANALMPHAQAQSQLPMSSSLQNNTQVQSQNSSQQATHSPVTPSSPLTPMSSPHQQQKHHLAHGFSRNPGASGLNNQAVKQRQQQPEQQQYQQPGRQHPNQRQHPLSQQQAKLVKGIGRGGILVQQNVSIDSSHLNGLSMPPASQTADKGDQIMHMRGQNLYPVSNLNPTQLSKPLGPAHSSNYSQLQQNLNSGRTTTSSKQLQPVVSPSDNSTQGQVPPVPSGHILSSLQTAVSSTVLSSDNPQLQQQSQLQSKKMNQTQSNVERMLQRNSQLHSDSTQADQPPENNASQIGTGTAVTRGCIDSSSVVPVSPTISSQWRTSESPFDSHVPAPATRVGSLGKAPVRNPAGNEPLPTMSQGQGPRQLSFVMPHVHNSVAQWQQRPLPIQQSSLQPILSQQPYQPHEQHQQDQDQRSPKHVTLQHQP